MGQAAEDALNGICCQVCGEWMDDFLESGDEPGFPQTCAGCGGDDDYDQEYPYPSPPKRKKQTQMQHLIDFFDTSKWRIAKSGNIVSDNVVVLKVSGPKATKKKIANMIMDAIKEFRGEEKSMSYEN